MHKKFTLPGTRNNLQSSSSWGQGMLLCTIGRISRITKDDFTPTQNHMFVVGHGCGWWTWSRVCAVGWWY